MLEILRQGSFYGFMNVQLAMVLKLKDHLLFLPVKLLLRGGYPLLQRYFHALAIEELPARRIAPR